MNSNIVIIGGGLAGLTAAIHLSKIGFSVLVIEKNSYPKHKVCGEYISNEVLPYLEWLGINPLEINAIQISNLHFSTVGGDAIKAKLPLGGFGISRFALDEFLYEKAKANGCDFIFQSVNDVNYSDNIFTIIVADGQIITSKVVLGAFGKRSNIDVKMKRDFVTKNSPWLAVKAHYYGEIDKNEVGLHNFRGGYCGVSMVENDKINVCYLANFESFKKHRNIEEYQQNVLAENPHLAEIMKFTSVFENPITISQISFDKKQSVENNMIMIGDTAGLIHPLCGNGMAMAIHSAKIASECTATFIRGGYLNRNEYENTYRELYRKHFSSRLATGRLLGSLLRNETLADVLLKSAANLPGIVPMIIKKTHGKIIQVLI